MLGARKQLSTIPLVVFSGGIELYRMGSTGEQPFNVMSKVVKASEEDPEMLTATLESSCVIEVSITSTPSLTDPWPTKRYKLIEVQDKVQLTEV